jgi:uncharacterized protein YndB with AHSA1/START domain
MPTATRSRTYTVAHDELWELIADPHHQPRWWPGVERMESVAVDSFTQVLKTRRGKPIRADFLITAREPPWMTIWEQQLPGTPFARVLSESLVQVNLEPAAQGTTVTISHRLKPRGYSRTGGFLIGRDAAKQLDRLLDGIATLV